MNGCVAANTTLTLTTIFHSSFRATVSLWEMRTRSESTKRYVLKQFRYAKHTTPEKLERDRKNQNYYIGELGVLQKLASENNFVGIASGLPELSRSIWLEYHGTSLEEMDICGK